MRTFDWRYLSTVKRVSLLSREQYYMDLFKPEYNISLIAGSPLGVKRSYEQVLNMSGQNSISYGKNLSDDIKERIRKAMSGDNNYFYKQTHTRFPRLECL